MRVSDKTLKFFQRNPSSFNLLDTLDSHLGENIAMAPHQSDPTCLQLRATTLWHVWQKTLAIISTEIVPILPRF
uniref:Uncharacterized protein n=1 Tax=Solanum tuberosum TaxID=4113 RepID=M1C434_SOLTU